MIKLVILGQPFWGLRVRDILNARAGEVEAEFLSPRQLLGRKGLRTALAAQLFLRVGYRPGAPTWRGRAFDALWALLGLLNPRAKGVHYWIGTDVLNTLEDHRAGRLRTGPMLRARRDLHWADAPWLVEELALVQIAAHFIAVPVPLEGVLPPERLPSPFTVLTYVPDSRAEFYDGPSIYEAARRLPEIRFEVIGGSGTWVEHPLPNLAFFGWQEIRPFLARAAVLVRLVRHDGLGGTVREALEAGLHVIYSQPMPAVQVVGFQDPDGLVAALHGLHERFGTGELAPNIAGHRYVMETFDLQTSLDTYVADLRRHLGDLPIPWKVDS